MKETMKMYHAVETFTHGGRSGGFLAARSEESAKNKLEKRRKEGNKLHELNISEDPFWDFYELEKEERNVVIKRVYTAYGKGYPGYNIEIIAQVGEKMLGLYSYPNVDSPTKEGLFKHLDRKGWLGELEGIIQKEGVFLDKKNFPYGKFPAAEVIELIMPFKKFKEVIESFIE